MPTASPGLFEGATFDTHAPVTLDLAGVAATLPGRRQRVAAGFLGFLVMRWVDISSATLADRVAGSAGR